jgi:hypothetical protein
MIYAQGTGFGPEVEAGVAKAVSAVLVAALVVASAAD